MYGETDAHPSGYGQGNGGFSGTPLWKLRQQTHHQALVQAAQQAYLDEQEAAKAEKEKLDAELQKGQRLIVDATVLPGRQGHRLARHVLVKDLRKVASALNIPLPAQGLFADTGQRALFALFDGQAAVAPDPKVVETCCRQMPVILLRNLAALPQHSCTPAFVKAALLKTFEDLERDLSAAPGGGSPGLAECSASVALVVGSWLFTAVLGRCNAVLFQGQGGAQEGAPRGHRDGGRPRYEATALAASANAGVGGSGAAAGAAPRPGKSVPEVMGVQVEVGEGFEPPLVVLAGTPVAGALTVQQIMDVGAGFVLRPRAVSGEVASRAAELLRNTSGGDGGDGAAQHPDCAVIAAFFRQPVEEVSSTAGAGGPAAKKAKTEEKAMESVRLRHIVVHHKDCKHPFDPVKGKPATRTQGEAEAALREALVELLKDGCHRGDGKWAATSTPRIMKVIRGLSECKSALKGGSQCGDLGWLGKKDLERLGKDSFAEPIRMLGVGEWSDVLHSEEGAHLVMRLA